MRIKTTTVSLMLVFLCISSILFAEPKPLSTEYEDWALGPFVPLESFEIGKSVATLGELYSVDKGKSSGSAMVMFYKFADGELAVLNDQIYSISVQKKNLKTVRGIEVGMRLSDVIEKYGKPRQIRKIEGEENTRYFYSLDGRYLSFDVAKKGIIVQINVMYDWN